MYKQITDLQEELETITKDYIDVMGGVKKYNRYVSTSHGGVFIFYTQN